MRIALRALAVFLGGGVLLWPLLGVSLVEEGFQTRAAFRWLPWIVSGGLAAAFVLSVALGRAGAARAAPATGATQERWVWGALAALAAAGFVLSDKYLNFCIDTFLVALLALGMNMILGMAGLFVLGYAAFYAVGAYTHAIASLVWGTPFWVDVVAGGLLAAGLGFVVGLPCLRLRGDYLAIATLGLGETIRYVLKNSTDLTGGTFGCPSGAFYEGWGVADVPAALASRAIGQPRLFGWPAEPDYVHFYYLGLVFVTAAVLLSFRLCRSRIGRAWIAVREDELAAGAMGIPVVRVKLTAFALGAGIAGVAGVLFAAKQKFVDPAPFDFNLSVLVLSVVVIGGMGSVAGCLTGAALLMLLTQILRDSFDGQFQEFRLLVYGAAMVLMMIYRPQGLVPDVRHREEWGARGDG